MVRLAFLDTMGITQAQMAAEMARQIAGPDIQIFCLGNETQPANEQVDTVMAEIGLRINQPNAPLSQITINPFDVIVTLNEESSKSCTFLPGRESVIRWKMQPLSDINLTGHETLEGLRNLRDDLHSRVKSLFYGGYLTTILAMKRNNELILDHFPEGIIVHDLNRHITWFNQAAEKITGYSRDDVLSKDCHDIFQNGLCGGLCSFCDDKTPLPEGNIDYSLNAQAKDGSPKRLEMSVMAIKNSLGEAQGVMGCFRDVTEVTHLRRNLKKIQSFHGIIGSDEKMQAIYDLISDLADSDFPVLIQGESGTGKELVAGAIHGEGRRAGRPFVPVNCGALPEGILESELFGHVRGAFTGAVRDKKGRFELADTGTIFLDEVGELSPMMQVKLLRVLQESVFEPVGGEKPIHVDVRVLSATNKDLRKMVAKGQFREDLYYRLCVVPITLPPIRDRRNDIPMLINFFIERFSKDSQRDIKGISEEALGRMLDYHWPGNVRELQNAIQYAYVKCKNDILKTEHLPPEIIGNTPDTKPSKKTRRRKLTTRQVLDALEATGGNKLKAAKNLGVGRATLHRFLKDQPISQNNKSKNFEI